MDPVFRISGKIVDIVNRRIFSGILTVEGGRIVGIEESEDVSKVFICPGLIDAHIHIESSMLIPSEFARLASVHGTVATVSDPHEIANVMGMDGVRFMIANGRKVPLKFYFGAPSCVPATPFETAGAELGVDEVDELLSLGEVHYMSEMMNFPGVLNASPEVMKKLSLAKKYGKPVDGHAPGLTGEDARKYIEAGISTDHECFTLEEAKEKIRYGMKILIREGSAARNLDALMPLMATDPAKIMFCSDDRHPNDLARDHMNGIVRRVIAAGYDPVEVLRSCVFNPVMHYDLDVGLLQKGDPADFIVVDDLSRFNVLETYIDGTRVATNNKTLIERVSEEPVNQFEATPLVLEDISVEALGDRIRVIEALDGQLITHPVEQGMNIEEGRVVSDPEHDILKMVIVNRYKKAPPAVAFVRNFGFKAGAIASSVAHDSHNVIAVGVDDEDIIGAINLVIRSRGGVSLAKGTEHMIVPLPVAGLMSEQDGWKVAGDYDAIDRRAKELGSSLRSPYMTLSFMALLVIPDLKLSDQGLFDGRSFRFTDLFVK